MNCYIRITLLILTFLYHPFCHAQFRDFRRAIIVTTDGDTLIGKAVYKLNMKEIKTLAFKDGRGKTKLSIGDIKRLTYPDGDRYEAHRLDSSATKKMLKTIVAGDVSLYVGSRFYYAQKGDTVSELYDAYELKGGEPQIYRIKSRLYLSRLAALFKDCPSLNYVPLSKKLTRKKLLDLYDAYARCKGLTIKNVRKKSSVSIGIQGGVLFPQFRSPVEGGIETRSRGGSNYLRGAVFMVDVAGRNKVKLRIELNKFTLGSSGSQYQTTLPYPGSATKEYKFYTYQATLESVELPLGIQYYFIRSKGGFYGALGGAFNLSVKGKLDVQGFATTNGKKKSYVPVSNNSSEISGGLFGGFWGTLGTEYEPVKNLVLYAEIKMKKNTELRYKSFIEFDNMDDNSVAREYDLVIYSLQTSVGLKYNIR